MALVLSDGMANGAVRNFANSLLAFNGTTWDRVRVPNTSKVFAISVTAEATLWTPATGKKFRLMGGCISLSAGTYLKFLDGSGGTEFHRTPVLGVDAVHAFLVNGGQGFLSAAANNLLRGLANAAATVTGTVWGTEE